MIRNESPVPPVRTLILFCTFILAVTAVTVADPQSPDMRFPFSSMDTLFSNPESLSPSTRKLLPDFETWLLPNGIPVIALKKNSGRSLKLSLVIRGGVTLSSIGKAGIEAAALTAMTRGHAGRTHDEIQSILDATSSGLGSSSSFDWSILSLFTLDKYFDRLFPLWAGSILTPTFDTEETSQVLSAMQLAYASGEQDPWTSTGRAVNESFFQGHPYAASPDGTASSLQSLDVEDVRSWYRESFTSDRLLVVAVGSFDSASLKKKLSETIGLLPPAPAGNPVPPPAFNSQKTSSLRVVEFPQSRGVAYVRGDFPAPSPADPDFMSLNVSLKMLSDLFFAIVRDTYGASYSPSASNRSFTANYGSLSIYKTKVAAKVKSYIDEAVATLARGECQTVDPALSSGKDGRMPVADALPAYRELFKNAWYDSQDSTTAITSRIISSALLRGDYRAYLLDSDLVDSVTPESLSRAFMNHVVHGSFSWVVLGSADAITGISGNEYQQFNLSAR